MDILEACEKDPSSCRLSLKPNREILRSKDEVGVTSLMKAASNPSSDCLKYILNIPGALKVLLNTDALQRNALHFAVSNQREENVELLVPHKKLSKQEDFFGNYPLHAAAEHSSVKIMSLLLEANPRALLAHNQKQKTPLQVAAKANFSPVLSVMKQHTHELVFLGSLCKDGEPATFMMFQQGKTPMWIRFLEISIQHGNKPMACQLVKLGVSTREKMPSSQKTGLGLAVEYNYMEVLHEMLRQVDPLSYYPVPCQKNSVIDACKLPEHHVLLLLLKTGFAVPGVGQVSRDVTHLDLLKAATKRFRGFGRKTLSLLDLSVYKVRQCLPNSGNMVFWALSLPLPPKLMSSLLFDVFPEETFLPRKC